MKFSVVMSCVAPDDCGAKVRDDKVTYAEGKNKAIVTGAGDSFTIATLTESGSALEAAVRGAIVINRICVEHDLPMWPAHRIDVIRQYDMVAP